MPGPSKGRHVITYAIIAEEASPQTAPQGQPATEGNPWTVFIMMGLVFVVFYFLLIRPQRKKEQERQKQREQMLASLKKSDHVVTIGGIHGIVSSVSADEVTIKVDEKSDVRLRVAREAIARVVGPEGESGGSDKATESPTPGA